MEKSIWKIKLENLDYILAEIDVISIRLKINQKKKKTQQKDVLYNK